MFIIIFFNKYYNWINSILFSLSAITYLSPFIGLGGDKSFIIYKLFDITRSGLFLFFINLLIASFAFKIILNNLIKYDLSNSSLKVFHDVSLRCGAFLLFLFSSSVFIINGFQNKFNCFRDTAYSSYPILINNIYDDILKYDFYTNAIQNTPKIFTAWILQIPYFFGVDWYDGVYLIHIFLNIIYLPLLFICINSILNQFHFKDNSNLLKIISLRIVTFILIWFRVIEFIQNNRSPMGWSSAFCSPYFNAEPDELALIFGLFFIYCIFKNFKYKNILCPILLSFCIFLHALYGLAIFSLFMIYYLSSRSEYLNSTIIYNFIFGIFFPSLLLFFIYGNHNHLDPEKFIEIYALTTHSFHFKISEIIGWPAFLWFIGYLLHLFLCLKMKDKFLIKLSFLSLLYFIIPPTIQFLGTEILKVKIIATLGLNRFSVFNSFIFVVNCLIILKKSNFFNSLIIYIENIKTFIQMKSRDDNKKIKVSNYKFSKISFLKFFQQKTFSIITLIIIVFAIWNFTKHNPLENYFLSWKRSEKNTSLVSLCTFIKKNTKEDTIVFVNGKDGFMSMQLSSAIRCFGHRATFSDFSFPLNESVLLEWEKRNNYCSNFEFLSLNDFFNLSEKYSLTHLLTTHDQAGQFDNMPSIWKSKNFILYDIENVKNFLIK